MTKEAALHAFFNSFGIPAYTTTSVEEDAEFPYMTYDSPSTSFDNGLVSITVNLWYYVTDESIPNKKVREISKRFNNGSISIACDGGGIILTKGNPFSQPVVDDTDPFIKRRYINITREDITLY